MSEFLRPFQEPIELPIQDFSLLADDILIQDFIRGITRFQENSSCVNVNEIKAYQEGQGLLTVGSYSCYAGIALNHKSLLMFHYRKTIPDNDISPIIMDSTAGFYGRGFLHEISGHWIEKTRLQQLPVIPFSEVNFLISEKGQIFYSYGTYEFPDRYEQ